MAAFTSRRAEAPKGTRWSAEGIGGTLILLILLLINGVRAGASWNLSADGDVRITADDHNDIELKLYAAGISLRKVLSDSMGDRFIFFGLLEGHDNLSDLMLHELYATYKGPMGKWNVTAGRFGLPFGLITNYTTSRVMYDSLYPQILRMEIDNGVKVTGVIGDVDYGLSVTLGQGPHDAPELPGENLVSGRIGLTRGDSGEISFGVSSAAGRTRMTHHTGIPHMRHKLLLVAFDVTYEPGHWITRMEFQAGEINNRNVFGGFGMIDYAVFPRWNMNAAANIAYSDRSTSGYGYIGAEYTGSMFTFRGGYKYDYSNDQEGHVLSFQIYRLVSYLF
jgi:hypothetical protein